MIKIFRCLFLLFLPLQVFCAKPTELLFIVQDAGETNAFIPFMKLLDEKKIPFQVLAGGTGEEILSKHSFLKDHLSSTKLEKSCPRDKKLSTTEIDHFVSLFSPKRILSGVAFEFQGQLMEAFQKNGSKTFAYWDNFSDDGDNPYFSTAHQVEKKADVVLLPSQIVKDAPSFKDRKELFVVGQPSLSFWQKGCIPEDFRKKLSLSKEKKTLLYVGGYGQDYEEAFYLFLKLLSHGDFSTSTVLIVPHPKVDGSFERNALEEMSLPIDIRVLSGVSTIDMAKICDIVLCHQSTVGMQALAIPKPVLFIMPKEQNYQNFIIDKGWVKRISEEDSLEEEIQKALKSTAPNLFSLMGIPENAEERMFEAIFSK